MGLFEAVSGEEFLQNIHETVTIDYLYYWQALFYPVFAG